jgi:hypothetical protein
MGDACVGKSLMKDLDKPGASGVQWKFFRQKSDPNMQFGCRAEKLMHYFGLISRKTG